MSAAKSSGKKRVSEYEAFKTGKLKRVAILDDFDLANLSKSVLPPVMLHCNKFEPRHSRSPTRTL